MVIVGACLLAIALLIVAYNFKQLERRYKDLCDYHTLARQQIDELKQQKRDLEDAVKHRDEQLSNYNFVPMNRSLVKQYTN